MSASTGRLRLGSEVRRLLLLHGGLYEPMNAERFWKQTGVVDALLTRGFEVLAPDRLSAPSSWTEDAEFIADTLSLEPSSSVIVVGGSNGCSTGARLAADHCFLVDGLMKGLVDGLVMCWPVTAGPEGFDEGSLARRIADASGGQAAADLLDGPTIRGTSDDELAALSMPVAVMASEPENPVHRRLTVERLERLLPNPTSLPPLPEPLAPTFDPDRFAAALEGWVRSWVNAD